MSLCRFIQITCVFLVATLQWGCTPRGPGNGNDNTGAGGPRWQLVQEGLPGALLSVSGVSQNQVYAVGADAGDGSGSTVLHFDGSGWRRLNTGTTGHLWWITDSPINNHFYIAGQNGLILEFDPRDGTFVRHETPGTELLFGIWGFNSTNLWAVGSDPNNQESLTGGVIWRYNGVRWSVEDLSFIAPDGVPSLFKVWGRSAREVYVCGFNGTILRYVGTNWLRVNAGTTRRLFTIHGNDTLITAVGGFGSGVIVEFDGFSFSDVTDAGTPTLNGVFLTANNFGVAVGADASVAFRGMDGEWTFQTTGLRTARDFHATWVDPEGGVWAVGGIVVSEPLIDGILAYYGPRTIPTGVE